MAGMYGFYELIWELLFLNPMHFMRKKLVFEAPLNYLYKKYY
jgi:hypothetical protein